MNIEYKKELIIYNIKLRMKELHIKQYQLADMLGVSQPYISMVLAGKIFFSIEKLFIIEEKLNMKIFAY
jgi:transcriptional regulator with XRE-family HTH domain